MKMLTRKEFLELPEEQMKEYQDEAQKQKEKRIGEIYEKFGDKIGSTNIFYSDDKVWERELKKILKSENLPLILSDLDASISLSLYKDTKVMNEYLQHSKLSSIARSLEGIGRFLRKPKKDVVSNNKCSYHEIDVSDLLGVVFVVLKLTGYITWPWIWVLSPFWIGPGILLAFALGCILYLKLKKD